ncbi:MAG TPA: helix-turn-helix domain-containing protein [Candidatus Caenarcaniphilales bacterium]|nr:helix-turn-helix domain-containing protein [Candidatus Caenarcaniphilales bacterium]
MDGQRVGRIVRALRRRRGWRQIDLARQAGCSQTEVSLVERGHLRSLPILVRIIASLDGHLVVDVRWRGGALDRLLDEEHASLVEAVAHSLADAGWQVEIEVTYAVYGERGSFDILAFMPSAPMLLVIEVKTDVASAEATLRKIDEKTRLAPRVARERFGWQGRKVGRVLVVSDTSTQRRRIRRHDALFARGFPARGREVRGWVSKPSGPISGLWFLSPSTPRAGIQRGGGRERVRPSESVPDSTDGAT